MKTLKQLLEEKPHYNDKVIIKYQLEAVKEWLTQKQQQLCPNYSGMINGYSEDISDCAKNDLINELLEELKQ